MTPDSGELLRRDLEALRGRLDALDHKIDSTDPNDPGQALRLDRIERDFAALLQRIDSLIGWIKWALGGGLTATAGTLAFVLYLLRTLADKTVAP